jgi:hypothetical protein
MNSFISSAVFAVGSLGYFFAEPLFSFYVNSPQDMAALATFFHFARRHQPSRAPLQFFLAAIRASAG